MHYKQDLLCWGTVQSNQYLHLHFSLQISYRGCEEPNHHPDSRINATAMQKGSISSEQPTRASTTQMLSSPPVELALPAELEQVIALYSGSLERVRSICCSGFVSSQNGLSGWDRCWGLEARVSVYVAAPKDSARNGCEWHPQRRKRGRLHRLRPSFRVVYGHLQTCYAAEIGLHVVTVCGRYQPADGASLQRWRSTTRTTGM
jgi:hypothetical protein